MKKPFIIKLTLFLNSIVLLLAIFGLLKQINLLPNLLESNIHLNESLIKLIVQASLASFFAFVLFGIIKRKSWGRLLVILFSIVILISHFYSMHNPNIALIPEELRGAGAAQAVMSSLTITYVIYIISSKRVKSYFKSEEKNL